MTCSFYIPVSDFSPPDQPGLYLVYGLPGMGKTCLLQQLTQDATQARYEDLSALCARFAPHGLADYINEKWPAATALYLDHWPRAQQYETHRQVLRAYLDDNIPPTQSITLALTSRIHWPLVTPQDSQYRLTAWEEAQIEAFFAAAPQAPVAYRTFIGAEVRHHIPQIAAIFHSTPTDDEHMKKIRAYLRRLFSTYGTIPPKETDSWLQGLASLALLPSPTDLQGLERVHAAAARQIENLPDLPTLRGRLRNNLVVRYEWQDDKRYLVWEPGLREALVAWFRKMYPDLYNVIRGAMEGEKK